MKTPAPPNSAQLRNDIDQGRAGDKVNYPDPAAAPLGTDDEAAGFTTPKHAVDRPDGPVRPPEHGSPSPAGARLTYLALVAIVVVLGGMGILAVLRLY